MLAVFLALKNFLTDFSTSVVSYINHLGGLRSRPLCKLVCQILLWSQGKLLSLRATYIPGAHNIGADILSRQGLRPRESRLHPEVVELIWKEFGQAQVDLFASQETSHCPLWFSLTHPPPLRLDAMTHTWPRLLRPFSTPELHPWGNFIPWSGRFSLLGVVTISWTQSTAQLVQCWSSCKICSLQG